MRYGVSYYPEHKTKKEIDIDIALIKECGMNVVRMGEFAWCRFEPVEGKYDFTWLDEVIDKLGRLEIPTVVCTPTACPPAWLVEKHPGILYKDNRGVIRPFGGRRHYCYNNPVYREYSGKIAGEIGKHYGSNPNVIAFQIDNEPAQEGTGRCHCEICGARFQQWLKDKYVTIEALNEKWGTIFWSQEYDNFGQINMPINTIEVAVQQRISMFYENPSLRLDYERFCSDSNIEYQNLQKNVLKKYITEQKKLVTTNGTGLATNSINYYDGFRELDVYAYDFYPSLRDLEISSFSYSFARGVKDNNFWLLEFVSGGGHRLGGSGRLQPYPGAMKQAVLHAFTSGASLLAHFQFKTFPYGAEQLNYAIVDLDGIPRRRYYEAQETAGDLKKLEKVFNSSKIANQVAVCFDYDALWACKIKPINADTFDYLDYCTEIYETFVQLGVGVDVVSYRQELEKYKLVIVPAPFVMEDSFKVRLEAYVKQGGTVLSTFIAAAKNEYNVGIASSLPCGLTDLFGIVVAEVEPVFGNTIENIAIDIGRVIFTGENKYWTEVLDSKGAQFIGTYSGDFRNDQGVISRNLYGRGKAYYVGTGLDGELLKKLFLSIIREEDIRRAPFKLEKGVEAIERIHEDGSSVYCIFNFLKKDTFVSLDKAYKNVLDGNVINGEVVINAKGYVILAGNQ